MNRFHKLISWDKPKDSGKTPPGKGSDFAADAAPSDSFPNPDKPSWDSFYGNDSAPTESDAPTEQGFSLDGTWSHLAAYRTHFLPVHYTPSYEYPLVVWLHSNGFNENQVEQVMPHISLRNYIGLGVRASKAADAIGHQFDWRDNPSGVAVAHDAIIECIDEAAARFSINASRVVIAGYQEGGTMALRVALRDPDRFAAVVSMGGRMPSGGIRNLQKLQQRRMPMLWQWSESNPEYNSANFKSDCQSVMTTGSQVEVRQYQGDDEMETVALRDIDDWIMRRVVSSSTFDQASERWSTSPTAYSSN